MSWLGVLPGVHCPSIPLLTLSVTLTGALGFATCGEAVEAGGTRRHPFPFPGIPVNERRAAEEVGGRALVLSRCSEWFCSLSLPFFVNPRGAW